MRKIRTTNPELIKITQTLRRKSQENGAGIWRDIADRLARSRQRRATVNVSHLNRHTKDGETVVIPGKVLGSGKINHPITIAAFTFSEKAKEEILNARGKPLSLLQLVKKNPKGSNIKIIG